MDTNGEVRFLVVSRKAQTGDAIEAQLRRNPTYTVERVETAPDALEKMQSQKYDCTILNIERFEKAQARLVRNFRALGFDFHIVIFADHINEAEQALVLDIKDFGIFLKTHINIKEDLDGMLLRFLQDSAKVAMRKHPRHPTKQKCTVTSLFAERSFEGEVVNVSKGGICVEVTSGNFAIGEEVSVLTHLDEVGKTLQSNGVVAWGSSNKKGKQTVGVKFNAATKAVPKKSA